MQGQHSPPVQVKECYVHNLNVTYRLILQKPNDVAIFFFQKNCLKRKLSFMKVEYSQQVNIYHSADLI